MLQRSCKRCGACCESGGPSLHVEDLPLILDGIIPVTSLITIRKNELVLHPKTNTVQPCSTELVKVNGKAKSWECLFFCKESGCGIYSRRPQACRILQCWDADALLDIIEKDTLSRADIIAGDDPLLPVLKEHDGKCSCKLLEALQQCTTVGLSATQKDEILNLVGLDISFRLEVAKLYHLNVQKELFYLGRPYFQLVQPLLQTGGGRIYESAGELHIDWGTL